MSENLGSAELDLTVNKSGLSSGLSSARAEAQGFVGKSSAMFTSLGNKAGVLGRSLTRNITLPIIGIGIAAGKVVLDFEKTMNTMGAVAQVPGPELKKLRDLAVEMGAKTVFSANEAAQAMLELAKAGISTADIMGGALASTLDLATAGDLELAEAALVASNAMNTFGLSGKQSKQVADALAGAANASSADVRDLAMALAQGGNAAATAGFSIQETTAALAAFADNGIKGSDAGTSLKTMLLNLVPTTDKAKEAMKELGLNFVRADGSIMGLQQVAGQLEDKLGGLSKAQQIVALKTIFGTDAFRAANIIMKEGAAGMVDYISETSKVGNASEVAAAKMKGLPGAVEQLKGSIETLLLRIGEQLTPMIQSVAGFLTVLANRFSALDPSIQKIVVVVGLVVAAMGPLLLVVKAVSLTMAALLSPVALVIAGLAALGVGLVIAYQKSEEFREIVNAAFSAVGELAKKVWPEVKETIAAAMEFIGAVIQRVTDTVKMIWNRWGNEIVSLAKTYWNLIRSAIEAALKVIKGIIQVVTGIIKGDWSQVWSGIKNILAGVWDAMIALVKAALGVVTNVISAAWDAVKALFNTAWARARDIVAGAWDKIKDAVKGGIREVMEFIKALPGRIKDALLKLPGQLFEIGKDAIQGLWDGMKEIWNDFYKWVKELPEKVIDAFEDILGIRSPSREFFRIGASIGDGLARGIHSTFGRIDATVMGMAQVTTAPMALVGSHSDRPSRTFNNNIVAQSGASPLEIASWIQRLELLHG